MRAPSPSIFRGSLVSAALLLGLCAPARAWDGVRQWNTDATDAAPGGSGIYGTGGAGDLGITCAHCHQGAAGKIDVGLAFDPALAIVNGAPVYQPGESYAVTATLIGEHLGLGQCGDSLKNINNFVA